MLTRPKLMPVILIILLVFLQYHLWLSKGGLLDTLRTKKQLAALQLQTEQMKQKNEKLIRQVQFLQNHDEAIESRARADLGMIKKNETFYQVLK